MKILGYLALGTSFFTPAYSLVGSSWNVTNVPATGLTDITFPITIVKADHIRGYYFAQQYRFLGLKGVARGYTGIQPRPNKNGKADLRGVFSSFVPGTTTRDKNCHSGADGGPGVSCGVQWNGVYGRKYDFEVKTTGNRRWVGTAIDTVTGRRIHIGSYVLPKGAQGIQGKQGGFVEWFPWNGRRNRPPNYCARLPYQKSIFGDPTTTHPDSVGTQSLSYKYGKCSAKVAFHTKKVAGGVENNTGFRGQRG